MEFRALEIEGQRDKTSCGEPQPLQDQEEEDP